MAIAYIGFSTGSTPQYGNNGDEPGMNLDTAEYEPKDPKQYLKNYAGQRRGFARNVDPEIGVTVKGELLGGATGIGGVVFGTAYTLSTANVPTTGVGGAFGIALTGGFYLDTVKLSTGREAWKTIEAAFISLPLIT